MATITCESCHIAFEGRPNRRYCSIKCRRKAEMKERSRKQKERHAAWLASLSPEEKTFWDSIPEFEINWTPDDQRAWEDELAKMPTLDEIMETNNLKGA